MVMVAIEAVGEFDETAASHNNVFDDFQPAKQIQGAVKASSVAKRQVVLDELGRGDGALFIEIGKDPKPKGSEALAVSAESGNEFISHWNKCSNFDGELRLSCIL
jgi:hypothetical protein